MAEKGVEEQVLAMERLRSWGICDTDKKMTGYQVETVKSGNSTPCECMANQWLERKDCVEVERHSLSQLSRQWQRAAV